jgi:two-component system, NarL family, sensor histidine kinase UhpB
MTNGTPLAHHLRQRLSGLPISYRIAVGNALIIIVGAVGGTLITLQLATQARAPWLIVFFATVGIALSVVINGWIVRTGLRPLRQLRVMVDRLQAGQTGIDTHLLESSDPDIRRLAESIAVMYEQLEERNRKLRALSERVINAQEDERKRIAGSLHGDTGQSLSTLIINLDRLEHHVPAEQADLRAGLAAARDLAKRTLQELRKSIVSLRPSILDDLGLVPAIRWYARTNLEPAGVRVEVHGPEEALPLPPQMTISLFRIAQEAINNIARHAQATTATITLTHSEQGICLLIEDNGRGFDVASASQQAVRYHRLGLLSIQERAVLVGGEATVESAPGGGSRVQACVPLPTVVEPGE